ncbi:endonuclease/exonuclease/phosphatase family protein [Cellulomonas sp. C5510]|uniref:endonuclease/exonuclease/phosphatase family protein n=1 Tax=Cellulomonas sp. C5510 TaxID=2871170 RepID=UPI002105B184|nr:endonuclease/exonuclease/phosphatase family protein [Cellulomonas sp. C5510]
MAALLAPDRLGLTGRAPWVQLVALRGLVAVALVLAAAVLLAAVAGWARVAEKTGLRRPGRRLPLALAALLVAGAGGQGAVLAGRGLDGDGPGAARADELVVLSFNTFGTVTAGELAALVQEQDADVAVLPETSGRTAREAARLLTDAGRPTTALAADAVGRRADGVAVLLRDALGGYRTTTQGLPATDLGTFAAVATGRSAATEPGAGTAADRTPPAPGVVVAVHTRAPSSRGSMPQWRAHVPGVADICRSTPGAVVAGDLNATLDHPGLADLGPCVDAAAVTGAAGLGTWPADLPRVLAAPIDHVLVDARVWRVTGFGVLPRVGTSDHRPVVAHLVRH